MSKTIYTPEWVKDAIFYQIFPDRFARSERVPKPSGLEPWDSPPTVHGYKGGDLLGIIERLDYLQDLGVTALYLNPIFQSASNHRYHTHDYLQVDPMLGGNAALEALIEAVHVRDMRIVLDGVFNHASRGFFQFNDILENGDKSAYLDWFEVRSFPLNAYGGKIGYEAWWGLPALPEFNTDTEAVREFLWGVATHWLERGIDGWRLDVPNEIDDDLFWQTFRQRCRKVNPECYIVGEIWEQPDRWLQGDQFDAIMNYPLSRAIFGLTARDINEAEVARCGYREIPLLSPRNFAEGLEPLLTTYPDAMTEVQFNLLGSHDTPRALTVLEEDKAALYMAYLLQLTLPGAPSIYYGDELGLTGGHDPDCRQAMPWEDKANWDHDLRAYLQNLIALRKKHRALRRGAFKTLYAADALYIWARYLEDEAFIGILNLGTEEERLSLDLSDAGALAGSYTPVLGGVSAELVDEVLSTDEIKGRSSLFLKRH